MVLLILSVSAQEKKYGTHLSGEGGNDRNGDPANIIISFLK